MELARKKPLKRKKKNQSLHEVSRNLINGECFLPCVVTFMKISPQRGDYERLPRPMSKLDFSCSYSTFGLWD